MRNVRILLSAASTLLRRRQKSLLKIPGNNLYYAAIGFAFLLDPGAAVFFLGLAVAVLFFPLSADPLGLIPRSRLQLLPLTLIERRTLRAVTPLLNPVTWLIAATAFWHRAALDLTLVLLALFLAAGFLPARIKQSSQGGASRWIPLMPGATSMMVLHNVRGLLTTLDFYCALIASAAGLAAKVSGQLSREAALPIAWVILVALSTCAQTLFGLEGHSGITRYRLMPLRGWRILLSKDIAYLLLSTILTIGILPVGGFAGALVALATVRKAAIIRNSPQLRWRLQAGTSFGTAIIQIILVIGAASWAHRTGPWVLVPCLVGWAASVWRGGMMLDHA